MMIRQNNIRMRLLNIPLFFWIVFNRTVNYRKHNYRRGFIVWFSNENELIGYEVAGDDIKSFHNHHQNVRYHLLRGILRSELR
jgi:hypothetical protein